MLIDNISLLLLFLSMVRIVETLKYSKLTGWLVKKEIMQEKYKQVMLSEFAIVVDIKYDFKNKYKSSASAYYDSK